MNQQMDIQIDIIVPVYNGFEELKKCVESIKKHTDLDKHRLILVDDKSPSPFGTGRITNNCARLP